MFTLRYLYLRRGIRAVVLFAHIQVLHAYESQHISAHVRSHGNCRDVFLRKTIANTLSLSACHPAQASSVTKIETPWVVQHVPSRYRKHVLVREVNHVWDRVEQFLKESACLEESEESRRSVSLLICNGVSHVVVQTSHFKVI
jgi:hypothetical protein